MHDTLAPRLIVGDRAPDTNVQDAHGAPYALAQLWADGPAVLMFLRHFG